MLAIALVSLRAATTCAFAPSSDFGPRRLARTDALSMLDAGGVDILAQTNPQSVADAPLLLAAAEWRQYVSLALVAGVLLDIVLGSPLANMALKPLKDAQEGLQDDDASDELKEAAAALQKRRERIDTDSVAQQALDKANNALELKQYLEANKSDWERMEELKRELDQRMVDIDEDLQQRQKKLDESNQ